MVIEELANERSEVERTLYLSLMNLSSVQLSGETTIREHAMSEATERVSSSFENLASTLPILVAIR